MKGEGGVLEGGKERESVKTRRNGGSGELENYGVWEIPLPARSEFRGPRAHRKVLGRWVVMLLAEGEKLSTRGLNLFFLISPARFEKNHTDDSRAWEPKRGCVSCQRLSGGGACALQGRHLTVKKFLDPRKHSPFSQGSPEAGQYAPEKKGRPAGDVKKKLKTTWIGSVGPRKNGGVRGTTKLEYAPVESGEKEVPQGQRQ